MVGALEEGLPGVIRREPMIGAADAEARDRRAANTASATPRRLASPAATHQAQGLPGEQRRPEQMQAPPPGDRPGRERPWRGFRSRGIGPFKPIRPGASSAGPILP